MRLVRRKNNEGRVPAVEVMRSTGFIRECIENKEKTKLIPSAIASGRSQYGMQTFDQSLFGLLAADLITYEEALRQSSNPDDFKLKVAGIESTSEMSVTDADAMDFSKEDSPFDFSTG